MLDEKYLKSGTYGKHHTSPSIFSFPPLPFVIFKMCGVKVRITKASGPCFSLRWNKRCEIGNTSVCWCVYRSLWVLPMIQAQRV